MRFIILCLIVFVGCTSGDTFERYNSIYEVYDEASLQTIYIDETELINVVEEDYQIINSPSGAEYDVGLGHWISVHRESLFVVEYDKKGIKEIDLQSGKRLAQYQFEGEGPGEYRRISYYYSDNNTHFIVDTSLSKIILYDSDWNHIKDIIFEDLYSHPFNDFAFSADKFYFMSASNKDFILNSVSFRKNADSVHAFHNRIIPLGKQPKQYNEVYMDHADGKIAVIHPTIPFVFLYDRDYKIEQILQINFPGLGEIEQNAGTSDAERGGVNTNEQVILNPPPIAIETDKRISMNYFIIDMLYLDDRIAVYYANRYADLRFLTVLKKENCSWEHESSYRFYKDDDTLFTTFKMTYDEPWIYMGGMFEENIIRVNLSDLVSR